MALYDPITGLPDQALFGDRLRQSMARADRRRGAFAVLVIDPGALDGDDGVRAAGAALTERVRATDTVAFLGGARLDTKRFAVIQTDLDRSDEAAFLAQKLLDGLGSQAAVGIALYPDDSRVPEDLPDLAGGALDAARARGISFAYHVRAVTDQATDRVGLARDLRAALKVGALRLHYQPKFDIAAGRITGAEALLRWEHPERGPIAPDLVLGVARESELIEPLGDWALRQACKDAATWPDASVAVNVEAEQFEAPVFSKTIAAALNDAGLAPARLEIEITESSLMRDPEQVADTLIGLAKLGVSITVDDFGTGYSSLAYLRRFPVDALKIDRAFVEELPENAEDAAIVRAIVSLAAALNLRVVAEGVSKETQLDFLRAEGCDLAQGYLIGEAMAAKDLEAMLGGG